MFDAAAEITKAVRNKKWINKNDKRKETYRPDLLSALIYTSHLRRERYVIFVRFTSERIIMYYLGKVGQVR